MTTVGTTQTRQGLGSRLAALARIVEMGPGRVDPKLLAESGKLLLRAGDRLKLSSEHTVVALAGGTGSGKSTLFNSISGLELSPTGVRRPTTARTHACVWGLDGAGPLLDWLQIQWRHRFARASALDRGESQLHGLILLDLPDHDSIRALTDTEADRLIQVADLVVWVLDPQKYADASTHRRYVTELAGQEAVTIFVLNQADRLEPEELVECVADLEDLLRREGVEKPVIVTTSAITGRGVDGLKAVLAQTVVRRRAAVQRLEADLDRLTLRLTKAVPAGGTPAVSISIDDARRIGLTDALCDAVGVPAVGEAMENVYGVRSMEWVGWPYTRWVARFRSDPLNSLRLGDLRDEIRGVTGGSVSAQPAEVDNAVQALADGLTSGMHESWRNGIKEAARSRSVQLPQVLSEELSEIAPRLDRVPGWWRLLLVWQYLLVLLSVAGLAWIGTALAYGVFGAGTLPEGLAVFGEAASLPWVVLMVFSVLGLGLLTAVASRNFVALGAGNERDRLEREMRRRVGGVAATMVIEPVERELARYNEFSSALRGVRA
ncbi:GTP-binding protein [Streptosporangium sp. NBC_01756]|uniref:GTP-binding protein n=1 Tax=Streptosporangium sp. NBC_01756 TaxID=2975950 RepID=UPI002DD9DF8A|nr:GTP-binding protein [Streptosporangium sp. NBC_01756]WSC88211.1 50S ribosome-binding GTPase [Streptosporangium sp. NBC_01756]